MENQSPKLPFNSVEEGHKFYASQVDDIEAAGMKLLWKSREALNFYESMPKIISHEQAHEAANLLRMKIIPALEKGYQNFNTSMGFEIQTDLAGVTEPIKVFYWYDQYLPEYRRSQLAIRQALDNLPAWATIRFSE